MDKIFQKIPYNSYPMKLVIKMIHLKYFADITFKNYANDIYSIISRYLFKIFYEYFTNLFIIHARGGLDFILGKVIQVHDHHLQIINMLDVNAPYNSNVPITYKGGFLYLTNLND